MTEPKLSRTEKLIVDAMLADTTKVWGAVDIADLAYKGRREWPTHWNSSISAIMRSIMLKTIYSNNRIVRASDLGRGNVAIYAVEKQKVRKRA